LASRLAAGAREHDRRRAEGGGLRQPRLTLDGESLADFIGMRTVVRWVCANR